MNVSRFLRTIRHLKASQLFYRILYKLTQPSSGDLPAPERKAIQYRTPTWIPKKTGYCDGAYVFLNQSKRVEIPSDWDDREMGLLWLYHLHYFDDINAKDEKGKVKRDAAFIEKWIAENKRGAGLDPYPTSLRIVNWIKWVLADNLPSDAMLESLASQTRMLMRRLEFHILANHLFVNAKALIFSGLFFEGDEAESWCNKGFAILSKELEEQVLGDGGHFELSPMYHASITEDLLDIIAMSNQVGYSLPSIYVEKVEAMLSWLAALTHPDGEVAYFNDAVQGHAPRLGALLRYAKSLGVDVGAEKKALFAESGYARLEQNPAVLLLDVGKIGPDYQPGHSHADSLSFELSLHGERIFVNTGVAHYNNTLDRQYERSTPAHNTVAIDAENSSEVWHAFRTGRRAAIKAFTFDKNKGTLTLSALHNGFRYLKGAPLHRRTFIMNNQSLKIIDTITGTGAHLINQFFNLAPGFSISSTDDNVFSIVSGDSVRVCRISFDPAVSTNVRKSRYAKGFGDVVPSNKITTEVYGVIPMTLTTKITWVL